MKPTNTEWKCAGCGIVSADRVRCCDCATESLFIWNGKEMRHEIKLPDPAIRQQALTDAAKLCRDKYCELMPGKRTWADLTGREREVDMICLDAAIASFNKAQ